MTNAATHWMRPLKCGRPKGQHVLIYVREHISDGIATPAERRVWCAYVVSGGWTMRLIGDYSSTDGLDKYLDMCCVAKGETTIWLLRGWTDLVLSGLAELMDAGFITWRYCSISGAKVLIRGSWRGRMVTITSVGNWTGGRWDNWGDVSGDTGVQRLMTVVGDSDHAPSSRRGEEECRSVETLAAIVAASDALALPRVAPTSAAAGLLVWRAWMGSTVTVEPQRGRAKKGQRAAKSEIYVAPLPNRPQKARAAERHVVYALPSRQLRRGLVDGPIYCVDVRSAYLLGLVTTPLPVLYSQTLNRPSSEQAIEAMCEHTGLALVRICTDDAYYPCRLSGTVVPCRGRYWTWLCGTELSAAYILGHVEETWCLHQWIGARMTPHAVSMCAGLMQVLSRADYAAVKKAWRAVYSSLVGRFAGWRKVWSDSSAAPGFGRWATWMQADPRTGDIVPYRAVAGKVQMLRSKEDMDTAVPLLYGCVTAQVRWFVQTMAKECGYENVYNVVADSLWLSQAGWQRLQGYVSRAGLPPDNLSTKSIYDRAWMNGKSVSVVERQGKRQLILPGVSDGAAVDADGHVVMDHADDWSGTDEPRASSGVRRRRVRYSVDRIVEQHGEPATVMPPGETVSIPLLDDALLQPLRGDRSIDDA